MHNRPLWYQEKHLNILSDVQSRGDAIKLVFVGDSIVSSWQDKGREAWETFFAPYEALNLGFDGDCTEDVMWRIENHQIDGLNPTLVILKIGTNNTGHRRDPAEKTALEITHLVDVIHQRLPKAHILLHALLPRGRKNHSPLRQINHQINHLIEPLSQRTYVSWFDAGDLFLDAQGVIPQNVMEDALHPNTEQYMLWAKALAPRIADIFNRFNRLD